MVEQLVISVLFIGALLYLVNLVRKHFAAKSESTGCAKGCGSCQASVNGKPAGKEMASADVK